MNEVSINSDKVLIDPNEAPVDSDKALVDLDEVLICSNDVLTDSDETITGSVSHAIYLHISYGRVRFTYVAFLAA